MLTKHLDVTYVMVWSLTLAHVMGAVICLSCSRWLAQVSRIRPEILLPIIVALVFVAAYEGSHDWGDLFSLFAFGVLGWFMKRLGWPRPPLVLGLVIGGIFERYLYISTELYGWGWVLRPAVLAILACVAWALFRPLSQIVAGLVQEFRHIGRHRLRLGASAAFTMTVMAVIAAAIVSAWDWPRTAQIVPLTAAGMALAAATFNLVNELFGKQQEAAAGVDGGVHVRGGVDHGVPPEQMRLRAALFFGWLAVFIALVWLIGFIPAIGVFVFLYMSVGFAEPWPHALGYAAGTTLVCWIVFDWALRVAWPQSLLGNMFPALRGAIGLI